jgi:hypothetical protein
MFSVEFEAIQLEINKNKVYSTQGIKTKHSRSARALAR